MTEGLNDNWLTITQAAHRVEVSQSTIRRYVRRDGLPIRMGRIRESELLEVEAAARARKHANLELGGARGH